MALYHGSWYNQEKCMEDFIIMANSKEEARKLLDQYTDTGTSIVFIDLIKFDEKAPICPLKDFIHILTE